MDRESDDKLCKPTAEPASICDWHPDYSLSSPEARKWKSENDQSLKQPLKIDSGGTYDVQSGDCLSTIAKRALSDAGEDANQKSIKQEEDAIIALNKDQYSSLSCNPDFLKVGWTLRLPCDDAPPKPTCKNDQHLSNSNDDSPTPEQQVEFVPPQYEGARSNQCVARPYQNSALDYNNYARRASFQLEREPLSSASD